MGFPEHGCLQCVQSEEDETTYQTEGLDPRMDSCVSQISYDFPLADIVVAGDLNQLSDQDIIERRGLIQIIYQPTRGANILDRV